MQWTRVIGALALAAAAGCGPGEVPMTPIELASAATATGATPMMLVTSSGDRMLSWVAVDSVSGREALFVEVTRDGATTGDPVVVVRDSLGGINPHGEAPPQLAESSDGAIYVMYTVGKEVPGSRFPRSALRLIRSDDGGRSWSEPVSVNEGERFGSHNFHAVLGGPGGAVHAAWLSSHHGRSMVWLRQSKDGGRTWDAARAIDSAAACPCCRTGLALGPDGSLYVAWRRIFEGEVRDVVVMRSPDGGATWNEPVRPREDGWVFGGCPHAGPSLEIDQAGVVHIAWWTGKPGEAGVYYARSADAGKTFAATPIAVGEKAAPAHVQLAVGDFGTVVGWDDGLSQSPRILLRTATPGGSFGPEIQLSQGGAATYPVFAVLRDTLQVAWSQKATEVYRADEAARPNMDDPKSVMSLPRVGQSEIFTRRAKVADLMIAN